MPRSIHLDMPRYFLKLGGNGGGGGNATAAAAVDANCASIPAANS